MESNNIYTEVINSIPSTAMKQYISKHPMYALEFTDCKLTLVIRNTLTYLEVSKCQI